MRVRHGEETPTPRGADRAPLRPASPGGARRLSLAAKRALDVLGAAAGLAVASPVLALAGAAILLTDGRPVLFRQARPGLGGRPFTILKLRTMRPARPGEVWYASDARRVSRLGRFLRRSSLDELPELWNVLRGEMSLVGPRPLLVEYLEHYTPEERRRHDVRPGLTGWAAVNGRHALKFRERLALDVWYVDHFSLWLDLRILARTVGQVLRRVDVAETQGIEEIGFPLPRDGMAVASRTGERPGTPESSPASARER